MRKHGPTGYTDYRSYKLWLRDEFTFRCVYCLFREMWYPNGSGSFAVEHAQPQSLAPDRVTDYENLLYSCNRCNSYKQSAEVLDPTRDVLVTHVQIQDDGNITALTDEGRRLIRILQLDDGDVTRWRGRFLDLLRRALAEDPVDVALLRQWFGFPENLPDLVAARPGGNTRPTGTRDCYLELRRRRALPDLSGLTLPPKPEPPPTAPVPPAPTPQRGSV